ncbi:MULTISPECIES: contact-dependent growth inhibition system immunity protein [unclassified Nocardioides]|uniref:contact-dependent growth inhibition system immunity protein n=1 Tax=unclassified Nocardioides TaxID=2615069 RepID=UPI003608C095
MSERPALEQLMGAYFHQDWKDDGTVWDVVDLFVSHEPELARALPDEVESTLTDKSTEPELKDYVIRELGAYYLADASGGTFREWLTEIADRVRTPAT